MRAIVDRYGVQFLLFALVVTQLLIWRGVAAMREDVGDLRTEMAIRACGDGGPYSTPCRVTVVNR